jgi:hypothetical protein
VQTSLIMTNSASGIASVEADFSNTADQGQILDRIRVFEMTSYIPPPPGTLIIIK